MKCYFKMLSQGLQDVANVLKSAWALPSDVYFVYLFMYTTVFTRIFPRYVHTCTVLLHAYRLCNACTLYSN